MNESLPTIDSPASFAAAVRWGIERSIGRGARRIVAVDRDFGDWPLGNADLLDRLSAWMRLPQRQLVLLGEDWEVAPRRHPRLAAWRRTWDHALSIWQAPEDLDLGLPTLLLDDGPLMLRLAGRDPWRGRVELDARAARVQREEGDAVLQRSTPAWPATQLGL
jgi:hypothetical protein